MPTTPCALCFWADPKTQLFVQGEPVVLVLSIYNGSAEPIFVSRPKSDEFLDFKIIGPDGKEVSWRGKGRIAAREYSPSDFAVLESYHQISAPRTISPKGGAGFVFDKPGQYSVTAEYSLEPPEYFVPFAGKTKMPTGSFRYQTAFCIEACIREPLPVHSNTAQAALNAVRVFYTQITKYRPLGIPEGPARKALWPLLSKRLAQELDGLQATTIGVTAMFSKRISTNPRLRGWRMACSRDQTKRQVQSSSPFSAAEPSENTEWTFTSGSLSKRHVATNSWHRNAMKAL